MVTCYFLPNLVHSVVFMKMTPVSTFDPELIIYLKKTSKLDIIEIDMITLKCFVVTTDVSFLSLNAHTLIILLHRGVTKDHSFVNCLLLLDA